MKKFNISVFIIILILLFTACSNQNNDVSIKQMHSGGEIPLFGLYSENEYRAYMDNKTIPEHFIRYENLVYLGDFEEVVFLEHAEALKYQSYMYGFVNGKNDISLYVYHSEDRESFKDDLKIITFQPNEDLRTLPSQESGVYIEQNVIYNYIKGELFSITWVSSGITYVMYTEPNLSNYKSGNDFINALLIKDEIAYAMEIFDQHISSSK